MNKYTLPVLMIGFLNLHFSYTAEQTIHIEVIMKTASKDLGSYKKSSVSLTILTKVNIKLESRSSVY